MRVFECFSRVCALVCVCVCVCVRVRVHVRVFLCLCVLRVRVTDCIKPEAETANHPGPQK